MFNVLSKFHAISKPTMRTLGLLCMGSNDSFCRIPNDKQTNGRLRITTWQLKSSFKPNVETKSYFNVEITSYFNVETTSDFNVETMSDFNVETMSDFNVETTSYSNIVSTSYFNVVSTSYFNVSYLNVETSSYFNVDLFQQNRMSFQHWSSTLFQRCSNLYLSAWIIPKNTDLAEDIEFLLPIECRWIPISGFQGEVENVSANQRPGRPSCFSDWLKNQTFGRGCCDLTSCQISLNSVQWFWRRSRKCLSQSEAETVILFFWSARKTQTRKRTLRYCFLSRFVEFRSAVLEEKSKMWKVNDWRTDDRQRVITIVDLSLQLSCT